VDSYPVVRQLGKGTFGEVFLSRNAKGEFAVKRIAKEQLIKVKVA
jgi:serine/threonine protein kinase